MTVATRTRIVFTEIPVTDPARACRLYESLSGGALTRNDGGPNRVHPLGLWFWGKVWTMVTWCETRAEFRMFRLDCMIDLARSGERFQPAPERSLAAWLRGYEAEFGPQA